MGDRAGDLPRFYDLLGELTQRCGGPRRLVECDGRSGWPQRGVYFFFDAREPRADAPTPRVVRVRVPHALLPSPSTLWGRLSQHQGQRGGGMPGGGNHRGSVFRLHVGAALLVTGNWPPAIRETWGVNSSAPTTVRRVEYPLEQAVSAYVARCPSFGSPSRTHQARQASEASSKPDPSRGEQLRASGVDPASEHWLGHHADRDAIRRSGLWNVNHVKDHHAPQFLDVLERCISAAR